MYTVSARCGRINLFGLVVFVCKILTIWSNYVCAVDIG